MIVLNIKSDEKYQWNDMHFFARNWLNRNSPETWHKICPTNLDTRSRILSFLYKKFHIVNLNWSPCNYWTEFESETANFDDIFQMAISFLIFEILTRFKKENEALDECFWIFHAKKLARQVPRCASVWLRCCLGQF